MEAIAEVCKAIDNPREAINEVHELIKKIANTKQSVRNQRISDEQCSMGAAGFIVDP